MRFLFSLYNSTENFRNQTFWSLEQIGLLAARLYVAWIFLKSGLLKVQSWETTLLLFEYEYAVPVLSPTVAAYLGTAGELILPVLLIAGLFGRLGAVGLLVVNLVAAIALAELTPAAFLHHVNWAILLFVIFVRGSGAISVDFLFTKLRNRFFQQGTIGLKLETN